MSAILDISHHQPPSSLNYDKLAKEVSLVIIRTQYGSKTIDRHYKTHHREFQKRGVPTAAYAWIRGVSIADMEKEATDFYNRTKQFDPTFWFLDVEEKSMSNMRAGTSAYLKKLRSLGAKKVGIYVAHHHYTAFNLNLAEADAVWIPRYSTQKPNWPCDLWQYTESGRLNGYNGPLDLSRLNGSKPMSYFTNGTVTTSDNIIKQLQKDLKKLGYNPGTIDGIDGPNTQKAVKAFQKAEGLKVDGIAGKNTLAKIKELLNGGLTMSEAKKINARLDKIEKELSKKANEPSRSDTPDPSHKKAWETATKKGILNGKNPHRHVTREQLATVFMSSIYNDSSAEEYAEDALAWADEHGISDASNPAHVMTRQQGITMMYRMWLLLSGEEEDRNKQEIE